MPSVQRKGTGAEMSEVATARSIFSIDPEGDIYLQCADLAAHVECRKELLALQLETINQGRTQFHAGLCGFVLG